jgi:hypothetical protein
MEVWSGVSMLLWRRDYDYSFFLFLFLGPV